MGTISQCFIDKKPKNINNPPKNIKLKGNITEDSFAYVILNNTFIVFKSINHIIYLIYCNINNSIICYNLEKEQKINEIKNSHEEYITNFKHYFDNEKKKRFNYDKIS